MAQRFLAHRRPAPLYAALLLTGCIATSSPGWLPSTFSNDTPYLDQLSPAKSPTSWNSRGVELDVKLEQSAGLGLVSLPELEDLLNKELKNIKATIGFPVLPGNVYVLASPTMNAMTTADGNIYVPVGMIIDIDSTDEMAALLAHELAHTLLHHSNTDLLNDIHKKGIHAWSLLNQWAGESGIDIKAAHRLRNAQAFSTAADRLLHPTWNRHQELDADKLAVDILVATGRDPNAMIVLLKRLDHWQQINRRLSQDMAQRNSALATAAAAKFPQKEWQGLIAEALSPAATEVEEKMERMSDTHMSTEERLAAVQAYLRQHYRKAARFAAETRQWKTTAHSAAVKRQAAAVRLAHDAANLLLAGNTAEAEQRLRRIPAQDGKQQNYHAMLRAMVAEERNQAAQVARIAGAIEQLRYPSYRLHIMEARARLAAAPAAQPASVRALYSRFDAYGRPRAYYTDLIQLAGLAGDTAFKYELIVRCYAAHLGEKPICSDAHAGKNTTSEGSGNSVLGEVIDIFRK